MTISHNSGALKSLADRIDRLDEELKTLNADKSEVYKEAKSNGYDVRMLKAAIKRRRKHESDPSMALAAEETEDAYFIAITSGGLSSQGGASKNPPAATAAPANGTVDESAPTRAHVHVREDVPGMSEYLRRVK